ncbi:GNAT family N-acetyltransferase [Pelagovum sp. HNIBRBA483]|uniref:GNAT family N-acetyltransferase n=1 Tax=Pelagovum sp. HNIBRBA483 TaxID=3233341 RepID=UPI0034A472A2
MTQPTIQRLYAVTEATWPAKDRRRVGRWIIREGGGGGSRVSSATLAAGEADASDLPEAEAAMRALGQVPLFMVRQGEDALDKLLDEAGYAVKDPVRFYIAPLTFDGGPAREYACWPPLEIQKEIWQAGGIGAARLDVMQRGCDPKTSILARNKDRPAGTCYVGIDGDIAMVHAIEVLESERRQGVGAALLKAAGAWAARNGAKWLSLIVTEANERAHCLYASNGMTVVGQYHYRIKPE